jgi:hypothetical protein
MIKRQGIIETISYCLGDANRPWGLKIDKDRLLNFVKAVGPFLDKELQVRVEGSIFSIYCNDETLFNSMCVALDHWILMTFSPANIAEHNFMINSTNKKVLCNHIPFKQYPYKVYIKYNMPLNTRTSFKKWAENYEGKIKLVSATYNWLNGVNSYNALVIYVADRPTLSMVGMFLGSSIAKVEEFIPRSSININTDQEQTCQHLVKV